MTGTPELHWQVWHNAYDDPDSALSRRLRTVEHELSAALDALPEGPLRLLSLCSGEGRDVLDVCARHPRGPDVSALLVDLDAALLERAADGAARLGLSSVRTRRADAGDPSAYRDDVDADVVLACGIFGNVPDGDIRHTIEMLPWLVRPGGSVVWTRHRRAPDLTPTIREWFAGAGFAERAFVAVEGTSASVGHHVRVGERPPGPPDRLFTFAGDGADAHC